MYNLSVHMQGPGGRPLTSHGVSASRKHVPLAATRVIELAGLKAGPGCQTLPHCLPHPTREMDVLDMTTVPDAREMLVREDCLPKEHVSCEHSKSFQEVV